MIRAGTMPSRGARSRGRKRLAASPRNSSVSRRHTDAARLAALHPRAARTRKLSWCKNSFARPSATTMDACARVCHSPTGYGLAPISLNVPPGVRRLDLGGASRRDDRSRRQSDDARPARFTHEEAAARGDEADCHRSATDRSRTHAARGSGLSLCHSYPAPTSRFFRRWRMSLSPKAWSTRPSFASAVDWDQLQVAAFVSEARDGPEEVAKIPASTEAIRGAARFFATGGNGAIYYGLGVTGRQPRLDHRYGHRQSRHGDRQHGPPGVGVNPLRGQVTCRAPATWARFRMSSPAIGTSPTMPPALCLKRCWRKPLDPEPGLRIPNMLELPSTARSRASMCRARTSSRSDPDTHHVAAGLAAMECVVVQDLFLNETANYAHVFLPAERTSKRTARSSMRNAASSSFARSMAPRTAMKTGRSRV